MFQNSLSSYFSIKVLISCSTMNDSLDRRVFLVWFFSVVVFAFITLNISSNSLMSYKIFAENPIRHCMGILLYITSYFFLDVFNIIFLTFKFCYFIFKFYFISQLMYNGTCSFSVYINVLVLVIHIHVSFFFKDSFPI